MEDPTAPNTFPFNHNPSTDHHHDHPGNDKHPPDDDYHHDDPDHDQVDSSSLSLIDQILMADDSILWDPLLSDDFLDPDIPLLNEPVLWGTPSQTGHHNDATHDYRQYEVGSTSHGCDGKGKSNDQGVKEGRAAVDNSRNQHDDHQENALVVEPLQGWPPNNDNNPTGPNYSCSCCQVLREIIHTNGTHTTKFEIHGRVGLLSHAILQNHYASNDGLAPTMQDCQMLDFCRESLENIKDYMKWYLEDHRQKGYILLQEPLSCFYEALCIGYDWVHHNSDEAHSQACQAETSNQGVNAPLEVTCYAMQVQPVANQQVPSLLKTELAVQRERIKSMTLGDFAKYFDTPIEEAAKQLRLCATVIKKKLRSFNISRWPYRKVRSIKRKISLWSKDMEVDNPEARARAEAEILKLQQQLAEILNGNIEILKNI